MTRGRTLSETSLSICMAATVLGVAWPIAARAADQPTTSPKTTTNAPAAPAPWVPVEKHSDPPAAASPSAGVNPSAPPVGMEEAAPVNTGHIHLELGADVTSEYWFRGIAQENQGLIFQPYADVTVGLINRGDFTVDAYMGTWNSLHRHTIDNGSASERDIDQWYESDFFLGAVIGLPHHLNLDVSYINLTSPATSSEFAQEIDVKALYDDSAFTKKHNLPFTLSPYALLAFEINGGSDAGDNQGTYLELGISPQFALTHSRNYPLTLSFPMKVGLGLNDYYETADGDDGTFGFFDIGADLSMPLTFIPSSYGAWQAHVGVHYIKLGDAAQEIGSTDLNVIPGDEDDSIYATVGVSMTY